MRKLACVKLPGWEQVMKQWGNKVACINDHNPLCRPFITMPPCKGAPCVSTQSFPTSRTVVHHLYTTLSFQLHAHKAKSFSKIFLRVQQQKIYRKDFGFVCAARDLRINLAIQYMLISIVYLENTPKNLIKIITVMLVNLTRQQISLSKCRLG